MRQKSKHVPIHRISARSETGIIVKHTCDLTDIGIVDFPHRDDYYVLTLLLNGTASALIDFKEITLTTHQGLVITPGQIHYPRLGNNIPQAWSLLVAVDNIPESGLQTLERYSLNTHPIEFPDDVVDDMSRLFEMLKSRINDTPFSKAVVSAILTLFCNAISPETVPGKDRYTSLTLRFKHMLGQHIVEKKSPGEYASMLNVSRVYLNEAVRAVTGQSAGHFIRLHIVTTAKRQLIHTTQDVRQIAASLGYDDYSYFSRLFKKETGKTPTEFRKNLVLSHHHL